MTYIKDKDNAQRIEFTPKEVGKETSIKILTILSLI